MSRSQPGRPPEGVAWREWRRSRWPIIEVAVDFMDMTKERRLWARSADVRRKGVECSVGRHVVVGDEDADPKVARIVAIDTDGNLELEILPGTVSPTRSPRTRSLTPTRAASASRVAAWTTTPPRPVLAELGDASQGETPNGCDADFAQSATGLRTRRHLDYRASSSWGSGRDAGG